MSTDHRCIHYPDRAWHGVVTIERNEHIGRDTYCLGFSCPQVAAPSSPGSSS